jgi:hypothetical protein
MVWIRPQGHGSTRTIYRLRPVADHYSDEAPKLDENGKPKLEIWKDYTFTQEEADLKIEEFWNNIANSKWK